MKRACGNLWQLGMIMILAGSAFLGFGCEAKSKEGASESPSPAISAASAVPPASPSADTTATPASSDAAASPIAATTDAAKERTWKLVWSDEFDYEGLPDPAKWGYDVGGMGWGNNELQYYTENRLENAQVKDGALTITAIKEDYEIRDYTSARLITKDKGDWLYGRFEIKAKLPKGVGTWPAIWMLPTDWTYGDWPNSGEIDIMEHVGFEHGKVHASTHSLKYYWQANTQKTAIIPVDNVDTDYHIYAMEWTPGRIEAFVDGTSYFVSTYDPAVDAEDGWKAWPFDQRFHLLLNIAVGGNWGGQQGVDETIWPQSMTVDYVRVYAEEK